MPSTSQSLLNYLRVVVGAWRDDPREDAALLARFAEDSDETAFRVLVCRHGPLVWQTCRIILGDTPDAEDAFQTTFLALARKAGRLRREPLAGWLHRVARQAAMDVQAGARRRRGLEQRLRAVKEPQAEGGVRSQADELYAVLDEELAILPEQLRVPLVLRYLEGKTLEEVARIVGCSRPVVSKRLVRGESILRKRLERRGLTVAVGSVAAVLMSSVTVSAAPAPLIGSTVRLALRSLSFPPLESSMSAALAEKVMKTMLVTKVRLVALLLGLALCLAGGGVLAYQALAGNTAESLQLGSEPREGTEAPHQAGAVARVDCFGDPLPAHALARMGTTRLWTGRNRALPKALAFSPDGKTLATPINYITVCLWDAATGKEIRRLTKKAVYRLNKKGEKVRVVENIASLGFSPDGKTLVAVSGLTVYRWEVATGKFLRKQEYQGPKRDNVQSLTVAFLPDGKILGFGNFLKSIEKGEVVRGIYIWDVATGKEICQLSEPRLEGRASRIVVKAFSPDGKLLAIVPEARIEKTIISLWDVAMGKEIRQVAYDGDVNAVTFSPDGKTLASADDQKICVWEVATGKRIHLFKKAEGFPCNLLAYSPDGKTLLGGSERSNHLWDVGTGKEIRSFGWKHAQVALFSPDGKILAMGDKVGAIRLWEVATGKEIGPRKGYRGLVRSVAYHPDGKILASMGEDETVRLWEVATGKEIRPLAKHTGWGSGWIAYSPDGKMLASTENVYGVHLWDTATGKEIRQFKNEVTDDSLMSPKSVAFSPDGRRLAAIFDYDQTVRLWEVATGKQIYSLPAALYGTSTCWPIAFSPDGWLLAVPRTDNTVTLWEVATGKEIRQLGVPKPEESSEHLFVQYLAFSPDGRMLVTSSGVDKKIHFWEVATGKQLDGLKDNVTNFGHGCTLAFSPDGRMLATAEQGNDGNNNFDPKVHLWKVASGKEIGQLTGHQAPVRTLAFSPDGKTLASGSDDLTGLIWDLAPFVGRLKPALVRTLPAQALSKEQLETAWVDLAKDPAKSYAAFGALQAVPTQAISLLQARLRPVAPVSDPKQLKRWIDDLDANNFTVRDKARREIAKLGEPAIPALRQALKGQPSVEVRRRLKDLLAELAPKEEFVVASPNRLRELRAVYVLESIGTAEAREVLQTWAKGVPGARLTMEAEAALARLVKRSAAKP